jgi:hypothetical protein
VAARPAYIVSLNSDLVNHDAGAWPVTLASCPFDLVPAMRR